MVDELQQKIFERLVKARMEEINLEATPEQIEMMADFVIGIAKLSQEIQKDVIITTIRRMKND